MAIKGKEVLGDAAGGAAIGSVAGPYGTAIGAGVGALYGLGKGLFGSDEDEAVAQAQAAKIEALKKAGIDIQAYRPELMAMEQAGKQEQLGQFGATDSLLAAMQGQGQGPDATMAHAIANRQAQADGLGPADLARPQTAQGGMRQFGPQLQPYANGPAPQPNLPEMQRRPLPISPLNLRKQ